MATSAHQQTATTQQTLGRVISAGVKAGLGGGLVFGLLMGMMGMLPMIGMMVGSSSAALGFVIHLGISTFIGATYALVARRLPALRAGVTAKQGGGGYRRLVCSRSRPVV